MVAVLIWLFYGPESEAEPRRGFWTVVLLGTVWSFVLDIPAFIGLVVAGHRFIG